VTTLAYTPRRQWQCQKCL